MHFYILCFENLLEMTVFGKINVTIHRNANAGLFSKSFVYINLHFKALQSLLLNKKNIEYSTKGLKTARIPSSIPIYSSTIYIYL